MNRFKLQLRRGIATAALLLACGAARAETIAVYCGAEDEQCQVMATGFKKATGIDVAGCIIEHVAAAGVPARKRSRNADLTDS